MLENVTVIIPAHNRPERLKRLLDYYNGTGIKILIPDSSDQPYEGNLSSPDITYLHRPRLHFLLKIREILPLITTDYVLYCADDDFAVPEAIKQITDFMDEHPDYSIAQGHYLTFTPDKDQIAFYPRYIRNFDNCITSDTPTSRLHNEKGMYASLLYGVTRSDIFRKIYGYCFNSSGELRFRNLFLAEEFFNHALLINGKYATIPCFFSARERIKGSATETTTPISVIKNSPEHQSEYHGFIEALSLMLTDAEGINLEEARRTMLHICSCPTDTPGILLKRKVNSFINRHRILRWASRLSDWRYQQKGLKAVKGMPSYPCTFSPPEKQAIIQAIHSTPQF